QQVAAQLTARGFAVDPSFVPLARRTTAKKHVVKTCWEWVLKRWVESPEDFDTGRCVGPPVSDVQEMSFTDWEITDVNGDGYPDVVFNSSPVITEVVQHAPPSSHPAPDAHVWVTTTDTATPKLPSSNEIDATLHVVCARLTRDPEPVA